MGLTGTGLGCWPVLMGWGGFVVWLIRLEGRRVENTKGIRGRWNPGREDRGAAKGAREDANAMLAEVRDDIKALIAKGGPK